MEPADGRAGTVRAMSDRPAAATRRRRPRAVRGRCPADLRAEIDARCRCPGRGGDEPARRVLARGRRPAGAGRRATLLRQGGPSGGQRQAPDLHRREALVVAAMPADAPVPRLLWTIDRGPGRLGRPRLRGRRRSPAGRALAGRRAGPGDASPLEALAERLTPSPIERRLARSGRRPRQRRRSQLGRRGRRRRPWPTGSMPGPAGTSTSSITLEGARRGGRPAADPAPPGPARRQPAADRRRRRVVDWPHARVGQPWVDLLWFAPSVAMQGGPDAGGPAPAVRAGRRRGPGGDRRGPGRDRRVLHPRVAAAGPARTADAAGVPGRPGPIARSWLASRRGLAGAVAQGAARPRSAARRPAGRDGRAVA